MPCLLDQTLERQAPRSINELIRCAKEAALGMTYLHSCVPVIHHRNLKPSNLVVYDDVCLVSDFGLWRPIPSHNFNLSHKDPLYWMSPEVLSGQPFTWSDDVYAFGLTLWQLFIRSSIPHPDPMPDELLSPKIHFCGSTSLPLAEAQTLLGSLVFFFCGVTTCFIRSVIFFVMGFCLIHVPPGKTHNSRYMYSIFINLNSKLLGPNTFKKTKI